MVETALGIAKQLLRKGRFFLTKLQYTITQLNELQATLKKLLLLFLLHNLMLTILIFEQRKKERKEIRQFVKSLLIEFKNFKFYFNLTFFLRLPKIC